MGAVTVDTIETLLIASVEKHNADYRSATQVVLDYKAALESVPANDTSTAEQSIARQTTARKKQAADEIAASKAVADASIADAERADARAAQLAENAKTRTAQRLAAAKGAAAQEVEAVKTAEEAKRAEAEETRRFLAAEAEKARAEQSIVTPGVKGAAPGRSAPSGILPISSQTRSEVNSSLADAGFAQNVAANKEINQLLIDRAELQARLKVATAEEAVEIRAELQALQLSSAYKRAGLSDTEAAVRLDEQLAVIERERAARDAEAAAAAAITNDRARELLGIKAAIRASDKDGALVLKDQQFAIQQQIAYERAGLSADEARLRSQAELLALQKARAEQSEKQTALDLRGVGRFAEGAGIGRSGGSVPALAGIVTAATIAGVAELSKKGLEYAETLKQDSDQLGLTTRDFQLYQRAAQEAGVKTDQFKAAFSSLADNIGKAQGGDKQLNRIFGADGLNINLGNAKDGFKSLSDVLPTLLDRLSKIPDQQRRFALETAAGGEELRKLDPILSQGASSFDEWSKRVEQAGGILADGDIQKADVTAKKIEALNDQLQRDLASTVANNADSILGLAKAFLALADGALKAFNAVSNANALFSLNHPTLTSIGNIGTGKTVDQSDREYRQQLLSNSSGRQSLLERNTNALNELNIADKGNGFNADLPGFYDAGVSNTADNPQARYAAHQRLLAFRSQITAADRAANATAPTAASRVQSGSPGSGNVFSPEGRKGPKGPSPEQLDAEEAQRTKQFQDQLSSLRDQALKAQEQMTGSIEKQAAIEKQLAEEQLKKQIGDPATGQKGDIDLQAQRDIDQINRTAKNNPLAAQQIAEVNEHAKQLKAQAQITFDAQQQERDQKTAADLVHAQTEHLQTTLQIDIDALGIQQSLAETSKERLKYQLQILDKEKQLALAPLEDQLKTLKPDDPALKDVQAKIDAINANQAGKVAEARQANASPGQQYVKSLGLNTDTIEQKEVDILGQFNSGLDKSIEKTLHLHGILGDIVNDLIDMAVKQALIKPLATALFGGDGSTPSSSGGSLFGGLFGGGSSGGGGIFGLLLSAIGLGGGGGFSGISQGTANNSIASAISGSLIAPLGLAGFATGGSFKVGGNGGVDQNTLSINNKPVVRVGQGETVSVTPQGAVPSQRGAMTLQQTINIDGRNSVTPIEFAGQILDQANSQARQYARQAGAQSIQASPARVQQAQVLGNG